MLGREFLTYYFIVNVYNYSFNYKDYVYMIVCIRDLYQMHRVSACVVYIVYMLFIIIQIIIYIY